MGGTTSTRSTPTPARWAGPAPTGPSGSGGRRRGTPTPTCPPSSSTTSCTTSTQSPIWTRGRSEKESITFKMSSYVCTFMMKDLTVLHSDWDYDGINIHKVGEYLRSVPFCPLPHHSQILLPSCSLRRTQSCDPSQRSFTFPVRAVKRFSCKYTIIFFFEIDD